MKKGAASSPLLTLILLLSNGILTPSYCFRNTRQIWRNPTFGQKSHTVSSFRSVDVETLGPFSCTQIKQELLSGAYLESDLVGVKVPDTEECILCVVRPDQGVYPLCQHEDDVETDLFIDPRRSSQAWTNDLIDSDVTKTYGEGFYGQRPVPSLGGGPGYGADADEIWSVDREVLVVLAADGVTVPVLDVGMAHGEKARSGAFD